MFPLVIKSLYEESFSIQNLIMEMWDFLWVCTFLKNYLPFLGACKHFPTPPESPINKFIKLALSRKKRTICFLNIYTSKYLCMDTHTHTHTPSLCPQFIGLLHTWKQIYMMGVMMQIWRIRDRSFGWKRESNERVQSKWLKEGWVGGTIGDKRFGSKWGRKQTWEKMASVDNLCWSKNCCFVTCT